MLNQRTILFDKTREICHNFGIIARECAPVSAACWDPPTFAMKAPGKRQSLPRSFWGEMGMALRTRVFVDFWNLQLTLNDRVGSDYRLDWKALSPRLVAEAETILGEPLSLEGTHVYLSYNPRTQTGKRLHDWSINFLDRCPGIRVISKERKTKRPPKCPSCYQSMTMCTQCRAQTGAQSKRALTLPLSPT